MLGMELRSSGKAVSATTNHFSSPDARQGKMKSLRQIIVAQRNGREVGELHHLPFLGGQLC